MKHFALAAVFALTCSSAFAQVFIGDKVPGHGDVTYYDLMKQVVPDLAVGEDGVTGHLIDGVEHIDGADSTGETPELVEISDVQAQTVKSGGENLLWVLADLGNGGNLGTYTLLAVFDASATPKLLDAKEVDVLDFTGFVDGPFAISADGEAMMVGSEHFNSSQSHQQRILAHMYEGKLQKIATFSLFGTRGCEEWTTEELTVSSEDDYQDFWGIDATILRQRALAGQECEDPLESDWRHREFIAQYIWDSSEKHYVVARNDFEDLAKMDEILY
jgi:hypothetical protein